MMHNSGAILHLSWTVCKVTSHRQPARSGGVLYDHDDSRNIMRVYDVAYNTNGTELENTSRHLALHLP